METIRIELDDANAALLREKSAQYGLTPNQLVNAAIQDLLSHPDPEFDAAARRVLSKNRNLYDRLA